MSLMTQTMMAVGLTVLAGLTSMQPNWFPSFGTIESVYEGSAQGWIILKADQSIADYYIHQLRFKYPKIQLPMRGPHITIVAGHKDVNSPHEHIVNKINGWTIRFEYEHLVRTNGRAFWLDVRSWGLDNIRARLGLPPRKDRPFHLTIGNIKNLALGVQVP